jgi:hypothetical protein
MAEAKSIEDVIRESLVAWRRNLIIGLPFFLNMIVSIFLIVAYFAFVYFYANPFSNIVTGDYISVLRSVNWILLFLDLLLAFALFVLMTILSAFFMSGAIGMANNALTKRETSVGDLFHYGRKHFIKVLLANIAILIIMMVSIAITLVVQMLLGGQYVNIAALILGMLFAPVPYAIVLSNCGVRDGLKKGTSVAWNNKLETVLIYIFVTSISSLISAISLAAMGLIAALVIALIPLQELSWVAISSAVLASVPIIAGGLIIAVIIYIAALILVAEPIVTVCWANYYLSRKENE